MPDPLYNIIYWFTNGEIGGISPLLLILILGGIAFAIYWVISRRPRMKEYKPIDLRKHIKRSLNILYKQFGESLGKPLIRDGVEVGKIIGFVPLIWNKQIPIKDNIRNQKLQEVKDAIVEASDSITDSPEKTSYPKKKVKVPVRMKLLKVSSNNKILKLLGIKTQYHIIENAIIDVEGDGWVINSNSQPSSFYDIIFYSTPSRDFIEDVGFRINRENELQEISNAVPRVVFWDNEFAKRAMIERERATIEEKKFKGQKESAED